MLASTQPSAHMPSCQGAAFDINMLTRPTQRRLMTLWTEISGHIVNCTLWEAATPAE